MSAVISFNPGGNATAPVEITFNETAELWSSTFVVNGDEQVTLHNPSIAKLKESIVRKFEFKGERPRVPVIVIDNLGLAYGEATSITSDWQRHIRVTFPKARKLGGNKSERVVKDAVFADTPENRALAATFIELDTRARSLSDEAWRARKRIVLADLKALED